MPKPNNGESEEEFVARYIHSEESKKKFPDEKQRLAVAYSEYKKRKKDTEIFFFKAPVSRFWEEEVEIRKSANKVEKSNERFIEVCVSGIKEDRDGEMMSQDAVDFMIKQYKSGTIPFFPDHGRDEKTGQSNVYSWKQMMGVWTDAHPENGNVFAVLRLNKAHPDQQLFWDYINAHMPIGFSVGGKPIENPTYIEMDTEIELNKEAEK